jgi:hypothetical protein
MHQKGPNGLDTYGVIRSQDDENAKREGLVVRIVVAATCCLDERCGAKGGYRVLGRSRDWGVHEGEEILDTRSLDSKGHDGSKYGGCDLA